MLYMVQVSKQLYSSNFSKQSQVPNWTTLTHIIGTNSSTEAHTNISTVWPVPYTCTQQYKCRQWWPCLIPMLSLGLISIVEAWVRDLTWDHEPCHLPPRLVQKHSLKHQLHQTQIVVAVGYRNFDTVLSKRMEMG